MPTPKAPAARGLRLYLALAAAVAVFAFWRFLSFQAFYLYKDIGSDSLNITYPRMRMLLGAGWPTWSFRQGLGQNVYPFGWNDPFLALLLFFGRDGVASGFALMEAIKLVCAGAFFFLYLGELGLGRTAKTAGALMYAFSGFAVVGSEWTIFSSEAVFAALLLWAFQRLAARGDGRLLPPAAALLAALQPFLLFPYAVLLGFLSWRRDRRFLLRLAGLYALGAGLAGFLLLPELREMLLGPRVAGASFFKSLAGRSPLELAGIPQSVTALLRTFSPDLLGGGGDYRGWSNYMEAPLFYCGTAAILLAPQALAAAPAALLALAVLFPYLRHALWLFAGDYYRTFSLFAVIVLATAAARGLDLRKRRPRVLGAALVLALAALFAVDAFRAPVDERLRLIVAALLVLNAGAIALLGRRRKLAAAALLVLIAGELAWTARRVAADRDVVTPQAPPYADGAAAALARIKAADPGFFRVVKTYRSNGSRYIGYNDAEAQDFFGTASYQPFNQPSYAAFLGELGVIDPAKKNDVVWIKGLGDRPRLMDLAGVKYVLSPDGVETRTTAKPLGFGVTRCLSREQFHARLDDALLLGAAVVDDPAACGVLGPRAADLTPTSFHEDRLEGTVAAPARELLVFSIPFDSGWSARVDGAPARLLRVDFGLTGLLIQPGDRRVALSFTPPLLWAGILLSLAALAVYGSQMRKR